MNFLVFVEREKTKQNLKKNIFKKKAEEKIFSIN